MFRTLHTSFLRFKKDSKSAVLPSTEAALLTGSINDADSSIEEEEEEEEEMYYDAEDFLRGELDCFPQITPPTPRYISVFAQKPIFVWENGFFCKFYCAPPVAT